jgi:hypothetical protein
MHWKWPETRARLIPPNSFLLHPNRVMAKDNREHETERPSGRDSRSQAGETPEVERSKYGDHPFLGNDRQPLAKELLHFPERPTVDPMTHLPSDPAREASRKAFETLPHDPNVDYQPPNPMLVVPPANASMKLLGAMAALILFALVVGLMFRNWMSPLPRHPGEQKQSPALEQKVP